MGKGRYVTAIVVAVLIFVLGIVLECTLFDPADGTPATSAAFIILFYCIGAFVANLIWFDGPVIRVGLFGIRICGVILSFLLGLLGSFLGWVILLLLFPFLLTALLAVATITLGAIFVVAAIMFPINIFRFAHDLY